MKLMTSRFGEIEVPDDSPISFPQGLVGFKECNRFVIFDCGEEGIFKWLQSVDNPEVAFVICEARLIVDDYKVVVGSQELEILGLEDINDAIACLILCIPTDPSQVTANLLGPIVFNSETRVGMQVVLINPEYSTRHLVFKPNSEQKAGEVSAAKGV